MALPTSGTISMGMINYEKANKVGTGTTVTTSNVTTTANADFVELAGDYQAAANEGATSRANLIAAPYGMNEWYGYTMNSCLLVGTEITMVDGSIKLVEDVVIDDEISSAVLPDMPKDNFLDYNLKELDNIIRKKDLVKSLIFDFKSRHWVINNLKCTGQHVVFAWKDKIKSFEWWQVKDIEVGDKMVTSDMKLEEVTTLEKKHGDFEIVTLGLRNIHTYFASGYLCHQ